MAWMALADALDSIGPRPRGVTVSIRSFQGRGDGFDSRRGYFADARRRA